MTQFWGDVIPLFYKFVHNSVVVDGFFAVTFSPKIFHRFSIGFMSGIWADHFEISIFFYRRETYIRQCDTEHFLAYNLLVDCEMLVKGERRAVEGDSGIH